MQNPYTSAFDKQGSSLVDMHTPPTGSVKGGSATAKIASRTFILARLQISCEDSCFFAEIYMQYLEQKAYLTVMYLKYRMM